MQFITKLRKTGSAALIVAFVAAIAFGQEPDHREAPSVPCPEIAVEEGHRLKTKTYAIGVQVYKWTGSSWSFVGPIANLYADANYRGQIGTHYGGPTWESKSGSRVVASRVNGCSPDPASIAWLLLRAVETSGPGIFKDVTFIQRVNTAGGSAPSVPGRFVGEEARVPYTTEYYFYRAEK